MEQKIANLGTNVFQVARTPFAATDFNVVIKALNTSRFCWKTGKRSETVHELQGCWSIRQHDCEGAIRG